MDKFLFWRKKNNPSESAAQHLANLMGTSVAGFIPDHQNDKVDINTELFRNNIAIASLVIIAGLVKGDEKQKTLILNSVESTYFRPKSFEHYLFDFLTKELRNNNAISHQLIEKEISGYSQAVYNEPANKKSLEGYFFKWKQILSFEPTDQQIAKAIDKCRSWAKENGYIFEN